MTRLFTDRERSDDSPKLHSEARYAFYDRVSGVVFDRIRALLQEWFDRYPEEHSGDLLARLQGTDDFGWLSAFWELYLHETFRRLGFSIEIHPEVPGTSKRPDFLVTPPAGEAFYLEATLASMSEGRRAAQRRLAVLFDAINAIKSSDFFIGIEVEAQGLSMPPVRRIVGGITRWLDGLDPDAIIAEGVDLDTLDRYEHIWQQDGWRIVLRPLPKSPEHRKPSRRAIGMQSEGAAFINTTESLRNAVREKAGRYGTLNRPYVVAALVEDAFADLGDAIGSLFGDIQIRIAVGPNGPGEPEAVRKPDGAWTAAGGPRNTRVSGVLVATNLVPNNVARLPLRLFLNPWAAHPLRSALPFAISVANLTTGEVEHQPARDSPAETLGLDPLWPGPEDPFPNE